MEVVLSHFTCVQTEAQSDEMACPESHYCDKGREPALGSKKCEVVVGVGILTPDTSLLSTHRLA